MEDIEKITNIYWVPIIRKPYETTHVGDITKSSQPPVRLELSSPFTNQEIESQRLVTFPNIALLVRGRWFQSACYLGKLKWWYTLAAKSVRPEMHLCTWAWRQKEEYIAQVAFISCTHPWKSHDAGPPVSKSALLSWKTKTDILPPLSSPTALLRSCARVGIWSGARAKASRPRAAHRHVLIKPSCTSGSHSLAHPGQQRNDLESLFQKNGNKEPR